MNSVIGRSFVKEGKSSLELDADDLFDKIINLKFTHKSGRSFSIRSDYEPVHHKDGTTSFKRCVQKPDIKIEYKQVAQSVAIEVNIYITNFFVGDGDKLDAKSINIAQGDPVERCIIQMGYRAQFPNWTAPERKGNIDQFYDLNNNALTSEAEVRRGNQISVQILTGYPQSYPPDKVTYFKGIIGTMDTGLRWNHTEINLIKGYNDPEFPPKQSEIQDALFQFVTRRFIRPGILHVVETVKDADNFEQTVKIAGLSHYRNNTYGVVGEFQAVDNTEDWEELELVESGIMSITDARIFGVQCFVSKTLQDIKANAYYNRDVTSEEAVVLRPIPPTPFNDMQNPIGAQLVSLQQHYPFLRWYMLMDGSFFFYHVDDEDKNLWNDPFTKRLQKENTVFLPAIYDMTPSGTRSIRCPFISFLSPLMSVLFESRYMIGTDVSFFYPPATNAFQVITSAVKFATVQEDNIMELMCVDLPPKEVVYDPKSGELKIKNIDKPEEEVLLNSRIEDFNNMQWIERILTVVIRRSSSLDTVGWWDDIVRNNVLSNVRFDRWSEETKITEKMALEALREWNLNYFDPDGEYMARNDGVYGESIENRPSGIGGRTGIKVPWLKPGDKIIVRYPFQSEYPEDEKVVV